MPAYGNMRRTSSPPDQLFCSSSSSGGASHQDNREGVLEPLVVSSTTSGVGTGARVYPNNNTQNCIYSVKPLDDAVLLKPPSSTTSILPEQPSSSSHSSGSSPAPGEAPDGGWGWVIVACSLVISLVQDGVSFSFGLIYIELLREFGASKSHTAWVGALFLAVPLLAGPLASALVEKYGCRSMTIFGGLLSAAGFIASAFLGQSIEILLLTFGIISGLGLALGYVTAVVSVAYWFDKRRSFANGIGVSGTGLGTFLLAPITQACIEEYGWRGTTLLLSGAFLHLCVCGAAMRDPDWLKRAKRRALKNKEGARTEGRVLEETVIVKDEGPVLVKMQRNGSLCPPVVSSGVLETQNKMYRGAMVRFNPPWTPSGIRHSGVHFSSCPELRMAVINNVHQQRQPEIRNPPPPPVIRVTAPPQLTPWWKVLLKRGLNSLDLGLFCEPAFFLLNAGTLLLFTWFIVPYFYLAEHMLRHGYQDSDASFLIALIGIPNTIAMVMLGWAGDKPWLPVSHTYAACLVLCGLATIAMPLLIHSFVGLACAAIVFGLSFASNFSFTPVLLTQLVPLDRFTAAYGLVLLIQGAGNLLGPPLAGWIFDLTGTWDLSFYLAGVFIVIAGLLTLLIPMYAPADCRKLSGNPQVINTPDSL